MPHRNLTRSLARALPFAPLLALAACGGNTADDGPERKTAAGGVLGGSISDAMLPLDTVTSQAPPLQGGTDDSEDPAAKPKSEAAPKPGGTASRPEPAPAPAKSPAPVAT
jgi:hypothetical protein